MNLFHILTVYFFKINFTLSFLLQLGLQIGIFPSDYPTQIVPAFLIFPVIATCLARPILHDLTALMVSDKACKLWPIP
jgi:hypothetical protein